MLSQLVHRLAEADSLDQLEEIEEHLVDLVAEGAEEAVVVALKGLVERRRALILRLADAEARARMAEERAERARQERAAWERLMDNAPAAIAVHRGPAHRFVFVNQGFRLATDGRRILGLDYADAFPEFVAQGYGDVFDRVLQTGEPFINHATRADTPREAGGEPEERYWNAIFQATRDAEGEADGVVTFAFEVTEQVMARRAAEAARSRLLDLARAVGALVWEMEPLTWTPLWVEGRAESIFGVGEAEVLEPETWTARVHPDDLDKVLQARAHSARGQDYGVEYRYGSEEAGWRWLFESGRATVSGDAARPGVQGLTLDVTAQREALELQSRSREAELEGQRLESLGLLAGGVAHDFNNLLMAVLGQASVAKLRLAGGHPALTNLRRIETSAQRAADLARQLLDFSGKGRFHLRNLDVNDVLEEILGLLQTTLQRRVRVELALTRTDAPVLADASQLQQVFMNLLLNAADAMGEQGGTIRVSSGVVHMDEGALLSLAGDPDSAEGAYLVVAIEDDGPGMDDQTLDRIFDPFFTTKDTGRGLGLSVALGVVRGHGGRIGVTSVLGEGTSFRVYLPVVDGGFDEETVPPQLLREHTGARILVIDDQQEVREVLEAMLRHGGHEVILASSGREGLAVVDEQDVDLVLLDLTMPEMGGEVVFAELMKRRPELPVLLMSGFSEQDVMGRLVGQGRAGFLQKPFQVGPLLETVSRFLGGGGEDAGS